MVQKIPREKDDLAGKALKEARFEAFRDHLRKLIFKTDG